jgi:hypothetical protein
MSGMPHEEGRYVDDDGNELNPNLIAKPALCVSCAKDGSGDTEEEVLCNLTRLDQDGEFEFRCFGYEPKKED